MVATVLTLAASAAAVLYAARFLDAPESWRRSAVKTLPILCGALLVLHLGGPALLAAALALCAIGDFALTREGERWFLAGLGAFLAAHLVYAGLFLARAEDGLAPAGWFAAALLAAYGVGFFAAIRRRLGGLAWPVAVYMAAIVGMGVAALAFGAPLAVAGAALFILSDSLLALELFVLRPAPRAVRQGVWWSYLAAQAAIAAPFLG